MSRILLADDSPHAQRMGERILRDEGFEVVTVTDGDTALLRLGDVDPDLVIADVSLPGKDGYQVCQFIRDQPRHRHVRVILTAGMLETLDEEQARRVHCDSLLRKPFEASAMLEAVKPLAEAARLARGVIEEISVSEHEAESSEPACEIDAERVRAAVTLALDAAMPTMIEELTRKVVNALQK